MNTFIQTAQIELDKIPEPRRKSKFKKALLGIVMIVGAVAFKVLGWWSLLQVPMFVLGGFLVAGDYLRIAVKGVKETMKVWKNGV